MNIEHKDWKHVEGCNFHGKWVRDMDREELYALIDHLMKHANRQRSEYLAFINALRDTKRKRGGAFQRWLFG